MPRTTLLGAIWPDWDEARGRGDLNTSLWRLRRTLSQIPNIGVVTSRDKVELRLDGNVAVDIVRLRQSVDAIRESPTDESIALLEALYRQCSGELLEGLDDEWVDEERRKWHRLRIEAIRLLVEWARAKRDVPRITSHLEALVALEPLDEGGHRELIHLYYSQGNRAMALQQYERVRALLTEELGVEPSVETQFLSEEIKRQPDIRRGSQEAFFDARSTGSTSVPMVGRIEPLRILAAAIERAESGLGSVHLVTGDVGIGKTRFVEAVAREGRIRQCDVLVGTCSDTSPPYQSIVQALWPRVTMSQSGSAWANPIVDRLLKVLMPEGRSPTLTHPSSGIPDSALLNECLVELLSDSMTIGPTILVLENAHNIDRATESLLTLLVGRLPRTRVSVLLTLRTQEREAERLIRHFTQLGASEIELPPLNRSEVGQLARNALGTPMVSDQLVDLLNDWSAGVPLVVLELLKFLVVESCFSRDQNGRLCADENALRTRVPPVEAGVAEVIRQRIRLLEGSARSILSAAAILGSEVGYDVLEEFMGIHEDQLIDSVEQLVEARLVHETEKGLRFTHEATRLATLGLLSGARLRKLHSKAASLLERRRPSKSEDIALHWYQAGEIDKALEFFEASGDKARSVYANEDAFRWYSRSLEAVGQLQDDEPSLLAKKAQLLTKRQEVLDFLGRRLEQSEDIDEILHVALVLKDPRLRAEGELLRSQVLCRLNLNTRAVASARLATRLFESVRDMAGRAKAQESLGVAFMAERDKESARSAFRTGLLLHRRMSNQAGEARCLVSLGTIACLEGRITQSMKYLNDAERILEEIGDRRSLAAAFLQKGVLYRCLGMNRRSKAYLARGITIMEEIGDRIGQARGKSQMAFTHISLGELREGLRESLTALKIARQAKDVRAQIVFLNNIAYGAYRVLGDFRRAAKAVSEAIRLATEELGKENIATYYDTMASILLDQAAHSEALQWARQARVLHQSWERRIDHVGLGISFRLGVAHLNQGEHVIAEPLLLEALAHWRRGEDLELQAHVVASLGLLYVRQGDMERALGCAREIERLMRRMDGIEQAQSIYWAQYLVFSQLGLGAAARRALSRASNSFLQQASGVKGRFRRLFVLIPVNRAIAIEAHRVGVTSPKTFPLAVPTSAIQNGGLPEGALISKAPMTAADRRRVLVMLLARGENGPKRLADRLRVSPRTIRNDLHVLRSQGFRTELLPGQIDER